jgi:O-acetyl-ADP-ribose deacetylase (regulator of RNase III)
MKSRLELEIRLGNLLEQTDVDAIVIPTNTDLMLTGELGGALTERGGPDLDAEAQRRGPIALGEATHLQNATLPFRYIILAAVTGMHPQDLVREQQAGTFTSGRTISEATLNSLDQAHIVGIESLAMPPIGVARADFRVDQCADIMLTEIRACHKSTGQVALRHDCLSGSAVLLRL